MYGTSVAHLIGHQSDADRECIAHLPKIYHGRIEHRSRIRKSDDDPSSIDRTCIESSLKAYRTSVEHLSKFYRPSIDLLSSFYRNSVEIKCRFYRKSLSKFYGSLSESNRNSIEIQLKFLRNWFTPTCNKFPFPAFPSVLLGGVENRSLHNPHLCSGYELVSIRISWHTPS